MSGAKHLLRCSRLAVIAAVLGLVACVSDPPGPTYDALFAYCSAVGDIDAPDARYNGPKIPPAVPRALGIRRYGPAAHRLLWRCMGSEVYACSPMGNRACLEKADTDRDPSEAVVAYCQKRRNAPMIPVDVTGLATVYAWRCHRGAPRITGTFAEPDARGFLADIWREVPPKPAL